MLFTDLIVRHSKRGDCSGCFPVTLILSGIATFLLFGRQPLLTWYLVLHEILGISTATVFNLPSRHLLGVYICHEVIFLLFLGRPGNSHVFCVSSFLTENIAKISLGRKRNWLQKKTD